MFSRYYKRGFLAYAKPDMLNSKKSLRTKKAVTDCWYLNGRIVKYNIVYPLLEDIFSLLGSSRCVHDVLSILGSKFLFIPWDCLEIQKDSEVFYQIMVVLPTFPKDFLLE